MGLTQGEAKRILVIDDDPDIRDIVERALRRGYYVVDTAEGGLTGLELLRRHQPHAVLLDLVMPGMDGQAFIRACRADPSGATVPIIIMSGNDVPAEALGQTQAHLKKPFSLAALYTVVERVAQAGGG